MSAKCDHISITGNRCETCGAPVEFVPCLSFTPDALAVPLKQFLELVDSAGADAPVWALELAYKLDGPKRYET